MQEREQRMSQRAFSSNPAPAPENAYAAAFKALQEKLRGVEGLKKSLESNPQDILTESLRKQVYDLQNENERLQFLLMKSNQESQMNYTASQQIEALQAEHLQHLKDYQDRVSELIRRNEELKHDKHEIQIAYESVQRQLFAYKTNEKGFLHKVELKKFEENASLQSSVKELAGKLKHKDSESKKIEKKVEFLQTERENAQRELQNYKSKYPPSKMNEYEKLIASLKIQLDEQDTLYQKSIDEIELNKSLKEEQMAKRIQDLIGKNNEYQQIISQLTLDFKELNMKYQQNKVKLDHEERHHKQHKRKLSQQEIECEQRTVAKLNLEHMSPPLTSPRLESTMRQSQLKQAIRECLEDMKNAQNNPYATSSGRKGEYRKSLLSPMSTSRYNEIELKLKGLNEKYESLIRQAQKENDFNNKAIIRKQLLEIAEQIKETTKFERQ